ncbi:TerB family tellurite resistance protein [Roseibium sediminis]|uniref:TerB family tellurite resistance protein n=1 Tax=Roseibium sediminis TaxID=1775174 RepID=UPI00123DE979|nr:TerB family tellurite resistance protein [Roseibium sediminis]
MHILFAVLGVLAAVGFWYYRLQNAASGVKAISEAALDIQAAARRFGFRQRANLHPVDSIEDARTAATTLLVLVATDDGSLSVREEDAILQQVSEVFGASKAEATELFQFSRWLSEQSKNPDDMARRLIKRTLHLGGPDTLPDLKRMVAAVGEADTGELSENSKQIIEKIKQLAH